MTQRLAVAGGLKVLGKLTDESSLRLHEQTADQLVRVLGGLKGGVMKFGQVLSVYETVLPPAISAVYQQRLASLQEAARPASAETACRVLEQDLGPQWRDMFQEFDTDAVAAASLGQVHRAVWRDGRAVAVKVQYPDARDALLSDREAVLFAMRCLTAVVAPQLDGRALAAGLMDRMAEELDYAREAQAQNTFRNGFRDDPAFVVPAVVAQRGRVLVSEWIDGTPLAQIIAAGSGEQRDRAGLLLSRLMFAGIPRCNMMHGDPHPGNYRLFDDGRLGVLDFGAMYRHPPGTPSPMQRWMTVHLAALCAADGSELVAALREAGFLASGVHVDAGRLKALFTVSGAPAYTELFTFDGAYLRELLERMTESITLGLSLAFPPDFVDAQRALGTTIGVLCQLQARVPFRGEALRWFTPELAPR